MQTSDMDEIARLLAERGIELEINERNGEKVAQLEQNVLYKNVDMEEMLESLVPHLKRRDVIGHAAARNTRVLRDELQEYAERKNDLVCKYGEAELDGDGNPTGKVSVLPTSPRFAEFLEEITPFAVIEHAPAIMRLKYEQVIGKLSGSEILDIDWMLEE